MTRRFTLLLLACLLLAPLAELYAQTAATRSQFVYMLRVAPAFHSPAAWTEKEHRIVGAHFARLAKSAQVILAGKTSEALDTTFGIVVFEADNESDARRFVEDDPAVAAGLMTATLHRYMVALRRQPRLRLASAARWSRRCARPAPCRRSGRPSDPGGSRRRPSRRR
jgi:uncharacterized protein